MVFYTVEELAKILKVSTRTVIQLIADKKIQASKVGRSWRISQENLDFFLEQTKNK